MFRQLRFGAMPVRLPGRPEPLALVVVHGFADKPMLLLTNLPARASFKAIWQVVGGYLTRWRIEEMIRFMKGAYNLEDIRVMTYNRLRNLVSLVGAVSYFAAVYLGAQLKLRVLAKQVVLTAKRFFEVPEFFYYALADGIAHALTATRQRMHNWRESAMPQVVHPSLFADS